MQLVYEIVKPLPVKEIKRFEDRLVYNSAVYTREFTKNVNAFPYLSGRLQMSEVSAPIVGRDLEYGLTAGVSYAKDVWVKTNANWTNPSTQPKWYYSVFTKEGNTIIHNALNTAIKEVN